MRPLRKPAEAVRELARLGSTQIAGALRRSGERMMQRGMHGAPVTTGPDRTVLLFFEDVERDRFVRHDRYVRRGARRIYHALTQGQRVTGFERAFRALCLGLTRAGCRVVVNNGRLARENPDFPVGICGYPHILDRWPLPNPAVLGPGLFDHPAQAPRLMADERFRSYLVPCDWMFELFAPYYTADRCRLWFAGVDLAAWPDLTQVPKDIDVLLYDKILWNRDSTHRTLVEPIQREIARRGLTLSTLRRGGYDRQEYLQLLGRARVMVFLSESETQGLAYQEAMACNVPVLAWDNGYWLDPMRARFTADPVPASSVPYFGPECGERFINAEEFPEALDRLLARLSEYHPRHYVRNSLSLERSGELYLAAYTAAAGDATCRETDVFTPGVSDALASAPSGQTESVTHS